MKKSKLYPLVGFVVVLILIIVVFWPKAKEGHFRSGSFYCTNPMLLPEIKAARGNPDWMLNLSGSCAYVTTSKTPFKLIECRDEMCSVMIYPEYETRFKAWVYYNDVPYLLFN